MLQQLKTWTALKSFQPRSRAYQRHHVPGSDIKAVTCGDATTPQLAMSSPQPAGSPSDNTITEDEDDTEQNSVIAGVSKPRQPDPQPTKRAKSHLLRNASNVGVLMKKIKFQAPIQTAVASYQTFLEGHEYIFHKPHVMLRSSSNTPYPAQSLEDSSWDEESDKDILREYFLNPSNIVLHSDYPQVAPHIVITPAEETPEDYYTPWNNRTGPQWSGYLTVPPFNLMTGRLLYCSNPGPISQEPIPPYADEIPVDKDISYENIFISPPHSPKAVFRPSRFNAFVERTANERLILYHVVTALQKHQYKVAACAASAYAADVRWRYEEPELLASIERPFKWTDPAEALLLSVKRMPGATIIESSCPFSAPHILINTPPPQNPWIPWHNAINDPQDGRYLVIPSPRVNYVNMDENIELNSMRTVSLAASSRFFFASDEDDDDVREEADYDVEDDLEADHSESPPPSRPGSPGPETPTDDTISMRSFFVRRPSFVIDEDDEDDRALAHAIVKNAVEEYYNSTSLLRLSLPVIEEEDSLEMEGLSPMPSSQTLADEEDDLPPFDDWYLGVTSRTLTPGLAVA